MRSLSFTERALLGVFVLVLVYSLWTASVGWNGSIIEKHGFRQTQTALTAFYMKKGGPFFAYETPVLGAPWSIPFEMPVYQWLVAKFSGLFGMALEQSGRFIGRCFFYLTLIPLFILLGHLEVSRPHRWIFLVLYLVSPFLLFWSRTFMIESTALFLSVTYLAAVARSLQTRDWRSYGAAAAFGVLGATVKVPTFFAFGVAAGLLVVRELQTRHGWRVRRWLRADLALHIGLFAVLPFLALYVWIAFTDQLKAENPMANFILSKELHRWNFGTLAQRLDGPVLSRVFQDQISGAIGAYKLWILSAVAILFARRRWPHYLLCVVFFLLPPLTFTNLHVVHDYYAYANVAFLVFALGFCIVGLVERGRARQVVGYTLFALALALAARDFMTGYYPTQMRSGGRLPEFGERIRTITRPDDILLIFGFDWNPTIVYYAERRGLMNRNHSAMDSWQMQTALKNLAHVRVGALILCDRYNGDKKTWEEVNHFIKFEPMPAIPGSWCEVYQRAE